MPEYLWVVPTNSTGRPIRSSGPGPDAVSPGGFGSVVHDVRHDKFDSFDHLTQVARAAEIAGFDGVVVPHDADGDDPWIVAAAIARSTTRLLVIPEFESSFATPVYTTKMSATFQRFSKGRLGWKLQVESDGAARRAFGNLRDDENYHSSTGEFLYIAKAFWNESPFTFKGRYFEVEAGGLNATLSQYAIPPIYLAGTSHSALTLSARFGDVHVVQLDSSTAPSQALSRVDELAGGLHRSVRHGLQVSVIARADEEEAWNVARRRWVESGRTERAFNDLVLGPNLWAGFDAIGHVTQVGLLGSYERVAATLRHYIEGGIDTFVLSGHPSLEEAYRLGEHVLPLVDERRLSIHQLTS